MGSFVYREKEGGEEAEESEVEEESESESKLSVEGASSGESPVLAAVLKVEWTVEVMKEDTSLSLGAMRLA